MGRFNLTVGATTVVPYVHGRQKSVKIRIFAQKIKIVKSLKIVVQRIQLLTIATTPQRRIIIIIMFVYYIYDINITRSLQKQHPQRRAELYTEGLMSAKLLSHTAHSG